MRVQFSTSMASLQYRGHAISDMRVADLRKELSDRGLDRAGTKNILVVRFAKALAEKGALELKEGDIESLESLCSQKGPRTPRNVRKSLPKDAVESGTTEQGTSTSQPSSEEKKETIRTRKRDSEAREQDSADLIGDQGEGEPEVIIVEEGGDEGTHDGNSRRSSTDMVTEIVIEGQSETNTEMLLDGQTEINTEESQFEKIEVTISEDPSGQLIIDSDAVKSEDSKSAKDDKVGDTSMTDAADSSYLFDESVAMATEGSKHPGYHSSEENEDGGGEYQSMPVEETTGQEAPVEEENVMSTDVAAQDDETPPGTPEQGPETSNSLLLFKPLKTTSEPKDTSTPATTNKAKSRPLIMSSALEEEVSEMEQLDFEEDHLLIFPELDEKQALDPSFEEQTEDKKTKGKAKELVAGKGSQKAVVTDESGDQLELKGLSVKSPGSGVLAVKKSPVRVAKKTGVDPAAKQGCSLWVRNIATTTRANDLKIHFSQFGAVLSAKIVAHPKDRDKHYGIITMQKPEDATKCIQNLHRTELHGRLILVEKGKQDTSQIVSGGAKKQPATNSKPGSSSTQITRNVKKTSTVSTSNRKPNPRTQRKPSTRTVSKSAYTKPSPVHPPSARFTTDRQQRTNSRSSHNLSRTSQKNGSRKESRPGQSSRSQVASSKPERIVQLSDEREEKRISRLSAKRGRDVQRGQTEQRRSSLEIREPDLRERLGPPVRPTPVSVRDRLGPRVGYERRALFDPEEDERLRLERETQMIEERSRQREVREVQRRELERQREREKQRDLQREIERREAERQQRELDRQRELQRQRDVERQRELERERLREREKLKQLERERERERERIRELERQRRQQEEERQRLQRDREIRELAAEKERLRVKQESVRRAADKARRERERIEREREEMEIALERERNRDWEMRRKRGPADPSLGFEPERKRVARDSWTGAEQRDQHMRSMRHVEDISPPHHQPGGYYETSHPPRMKSSPSTRQRWPQDRGGPKPGGNLLQQIAQNQRELLDKISNRDEPSHEFGGPVSPEGPMYDMEPKFSSSTGGLDPVTLTRLASAAHGLHSDQAAVAALAVLQGSGSGRMESGGKKRQGPMERKPEKKGDGGKPSGKKEFGGPPPRPAQRAGGSQRGRGAPPSRNPGGQKSASELASFAQQLLGTEQPSPFVGGTPVLHPGMMRPYPLTMARMGAPPFAMRPFLRPGMHPLARMPGHDRFGMGYQHH